MTMLQFGGRLRIDHRAPLLHEEYYKERLVVTDHPKIIMRVEVSKYPQMSRKVRIRLLIILFA